MKHTLTFHTLSHNLVDNQKTDNIVDEASFPRVGRNAGGCAEEGRARDGESGSGRCRWTMIFPIIARRSSGKRRTFVEMSGQRLATAASERTAAVSGDDDVRSLRRHHHHSTAAVAAAADTWSARRPVTVRRRVGVDVRQKKLMLQRRAAGARRRFIGVRQRSASRYRRSAHPAAVLVDVVRRVRPAATTAGARGGQGPDAGDHRRIAVRVGVVHHLLGHLGRVGVAVVKVVLPVTATRASR